MNEFKGTKGKWQQSILRDRTFGIVNESNDIVCESPSFRKGFENWEANALLISKAPEMLEMLNSIVENYKSGNEDNFIMSNLIDKSEKLIKESTEI